MSNVREIESTLNKLILQGEGMQGFETYYADHCVMQENVDELRVGKDACRAYEEAFFGNVAEFHGAELHHSAVDGDRSYSEWTFDVTFKDGTRLRNRQIAARKWEDGKVVEERFFYKPNVVSA